MEGGQWGTAQVQQTDIEILETSQKEGGQWGTAQVQQTDIEILETSQKEGGQWGTAQVQQTDIEIQAYEILHHKANLNGYLAYHTGQSYDQIVQDTDRDFFMSATEAKEYGLIDAVITNPLKALNAAPVAA
ncbi:unnamed protein product [Closterium sp. NIES-53]